MLIQFHILQNYAPSNLNRDDTGSPKDAIFGGKRRGRISSQCLKRSIRRSAAFQDAFRATDLLGVRTKKLPSLIEEELRKLGADDEIVKAIVKRVPKIGRESGKKGPESDDGKDKNTDESIGEVETKQLIFIAPNELSILAGKLLESYMRIGAAKWANTPIEDITKQLGDVLPRSVDIAMFGRMTTSSAFKDVKASVQVAHALSTNALSEEFDYFTAVDDLSGETETGASMINDVEFNSSTYYKYLNVHWEKLVENLGGDVAAARKAVLALLEAAATAHPTGKQNTFAAFNLPDFILVEVSERNLPVSYANAFLKPAYASGDRTLMDASIDLLAGYLEKISGAYNLTPARAYLCLTNSSLNGAQKAESLAALQDWLADQLPAEK